MHEIRYLDYGVDVKKEDIEKDTNNIASRCSDYGDGLYSPIRYYDVICESRQVAEDFIEQHDGSYSNLAVKYKDYIIEKRTAKYNDLVNRVKELKNSLALLNKDLYYTSSKVKSKYITCKECGSKISVKHINSNMCPVCKTDMRPDSFKEKIENIKKRIDDINQRIDVEDKKAKEKAKYKINWLVKIEYHV